MEMCINQLPTNLRPGQASRVPMDRRLGRLQDLDWTLRQTLCMPALSNRYPIHRNHRVTQTHTTDTGLSKLQGT